MFRTLSRLRGRDTHLGGSELSHAQFELLIELDERGELSAGELALAARLAPGTVTQMLDHLAESGHVERARSETDRRVVVSRLTPQGRRKIEAKREGLAEPLGAGALRGVEASELRAATRVLERLGDGVRGCAPGRRVQRGLGRASVSVQPESAKLSSGRKPGFLCYSRPRPAGGAVVRAVRRGTTKMETSSR